MAFFSTKKSPRVSPRLSPRFKSKTLKEEEISGMEVYGKGHPLNRDQILFHI